MSFRPLLLTALLVLASCAYTQEGQQQDIAFETPGANNAVCYVYIEKLKYKVRPPQKITVSKSKDDLIVDCLAPGNRRKKQVIEAAMSKKVYRDIPILPALGWDIASSSLYKYPDIVTVDFTNSQVKPEDLPAQNRPDVKQPEEYPLEEKLPIRLRMNSDINAPPVLLQKRVPDKADTEGPYMVETGGSSPDKGKLEKAVNPAGAPSPSAASKAPATGPAYPGQ